MKVVSFSDQWVDDLRRLLDPSIEYVVLDAGDAAGRARELPGAEILFTMHFDAEMAALCVSLRMILCPAAGTEGIDRAAVPAGVPVLNSAGPEISIAEYVIGALVALRQNFFGIDRDLRSGIWSQGWLHPERWTGELYGSNLGLIGFGRIGQEVALRAKSFGMRCRAVTMHPDKASRRNELVERIAGIAQAAEVDALIAWADAVVICCELSAVTRGLIDARRLGLAGPSAVVVNVARGPIVVERDLYEALRGRRIAGAAIDVWYRYPSKPHERMMPSVFPFSELDNVIMTPHSSAWTLPHKHRKLAYWSRILNEFARTGKVVAAPA